MGQEHLVKAFTKW